MNHGVRPHAQHLLCAALFCVAGMTLYASRVIVVALFIITIVAALSVGPRPDLRRHTDPWLLGAVAGLLLVCGLSALWSELPQRSIDTWWRVALLLGSGTVLVQLLSCASPALARRSLNSFCLGVSVLVLLLLAEWVLGGRPGSWLKGHAHSSLLFSSHATALLVVVAWPAAAWMATRARWRMVVFGVLVTVAVALLPLAAASAALATGAVTWLLIVRFGQRAVRVMVLAGWVLVLGAPFLFSMSLELARGTDVSHSHSSVAHRLVIWQYFSERIRDRPLLGYGLGLSKRSADDPRARAHYERLARSVNGEMFTAHPPLHPHNSILQLWHDLGLAGVLCMLILVTAATRHVRWLPRSDRAWAGASVVSWAVIACVSFGLWQKWWLAASGIAVAIAALLLVARAQVVPVPEKESPGGA